MRDTSDDEATPMHDDFHDDRLQDQRPPALPLTEAQASVLLKHLNRGTMSLDDAAVLTGVSADDLALQFHGRRANRVSGDPSREEASERTPRRGRPSRPPQDDEAEDEPGLHAPERRSRRSSDGGTMWAIWTFAGVAALSGVALLSGIPQSLLFPPRGVSEHSDARTPGSAPPPAATEAAATPTDAVPVDESAPAPADPAMAEAPPVDPNAPVVDPVPADPAAAPPADGAVAQAPVPSAPEEVAPAVATAETETNFGPAPAAPEFTDPTPAPAPPPAPAVTGATDTLFATRASTVRDTPTVTGSTVTGQLKRGDSVTGAPVTGTDGKSPWIKIESGPGAGGYVSAANLSQSPRPAVALSIGQPRVLTKSAALHAGPDAGSDTLDTLNPGISVLAAAEVEGGWIEINRRAGGVGYIRKEAFE